MYGDHVRDVLVEGVLLPPVVDQLLDLRVRVLHLDRLPHLSRRVRVGRLGHDSLLVAIAVVTPPDKKKTRKDDV